MAVVFRFLSTNPTRCRILSPNTFTVLHFLSFPAFSYSKREITGAKTRSNHTCDTALDSHSENKTPLSLSSAVNKRPQLHSGTTLNPLHPPPPPKTMGNLSVIGQPQRCSRAEHWHAQTWLCHLLSYVCQLTREKQTFQTMCEQKNSPGKIKNRHRNEVHRRQQLIKTLI